MHEFEKWLLERLVAVGALCLNDPAPDVPAALVLYQKSEQMTVSGEPDLPTIAKLRRVPREKYGVEFFDYLKVPSMAGSRYMPEVAAA